MAAENQPLDSRAHQVLDTLNAEGVCIGRLAQGSIMDKGFWHRYVHVWILDLSESTALLHKRAPQHPRFGGMWCCTSGVVLHGMSSLTAAKGHVSFLRPDDDAYDFVFSSKEVLKQESNQESNQEIKQFVDVYVVGMKYPPGVDEVFYDASEVTQSKYFTLSELGTILARSDPEFMQVSQSYVHRLLTYMTKVVTIFQRDKRNVDPDEERHSKKGLQLLDTVGSMGRLAEPHLLDVISDPCKRNDAYEHSIWHRAVHVWVLDMDSGQVLLQQRNHKKRHFGGRWNCSTGHIKMGEESLPTALKSVKDDVGLTHLCEDDFEFLFQSNSVMDTGGGCMLKQVVDVYVVSVPNKGSYSEVPAVDLMTFAQGEVLGAQYVSLDALEQLWNGDDSLDLVRPSSYEYMDRFLYYARRRCMKYHGEAKRLLGVAHQVHT